jgi:anaerobic ribonucleoside-triphosphate reductase
MEHLIEVGNTYNISKFRIINAKPTYKPFDAQLMMVFTDFTSIIVARNVPKTFPAYVYSLSPHLKVLLQLLGLSKSSQVSSYRHASYYQNCSNQSTYKDTDNTTHNKMLCRCDWVH